MFIVVLKGGNSPEAEISLQTAHNVEHSLQRLGHKVVAIEGFPDFLKDILQLTPKPDLIFIAMHGDIGENGVVQGFCESMGLPYTHSGVLASAICMHKPIAKKIFQAINIPTPNSMIIEMGLTPILPANFNLTPPYIIKPLANGSSINTFLIENVAELQAKREGLFSLGEEWLLEEYIPGKELVTGMLGTNYIGAIEVSMPTDHVFSYDFKYSAGYTKYTAPIDLPADIQEKLKTYTTIAHMQCGCEVLSRSDFRYNPQTNELFLLEINTHPGLTTNSMFPVIAQNAGINFDSMVNTILQASLAKKSTTLKSITKMPQTL